MSETRKISVRKIMQLLVTVTVTGTCLFALLSAASLERNEKIKDIKINIKNAQYGFVDKNEIEGFLAANNDGDILNTTIARLNENKIEKTVVTNPWVADAQVYVDNDKVVHINLSQRVPVARLFDQAGNSYYLDHTMKAMPLSSKYIHYTTIVTNVPVLKDDSMGNALKAQIAALVTRIDKDSFWRAQISQVIVTNDRTFEIVPVLGSQKIIVGDTSRLDEKFDNLLAFYKKVLNCIGWEKYQTLDLRYAGQVVALPALPWKAPVNNAIGGMNWVKTVIGKDSNMYRVDSATMQIKQTKAAIVPKNTFPKMVVAKPKAAVNKNTKQPEKHIVAKPAVVVVNKDKKKPEKQPVAKPKVVVAAKPQAKTVVKKQNKKPVKTQPKKVTQPKKEQQPKYLYQ
jgi:cell division protein FtsQ